jgi:hypothetical protein
MKRAGVCLLCFFERLMGLGEISISGALISFPIPAIPGNPVNNSVQALKFN